MFFMAFVSAYIVRKDMPNSAWIPLQVPRILWLNTLILIASSFTLARAHNRFTAKDDEGFRHWWATTTFLGILFVAGQILAWRQLAAEGIFLAIEPQQQFLLCFHRGARCAPARRNSRAAATCNSAPREKWRAAPRSKLSPCTGILWMGYGSSCFYSSTWEGEA